MQALPNLTAARLSELRDILSDRLGKERFRHTLGVEKMALRLGKMLLPDALFELSAAALLHDVTKELPYGEQLQMCKKYRIRMPKAEYAAEKILHARTGARYAREHFPDVVTGRVFKAIDRHTTGKASMSLFDEIVFLSDIIEEHRNYPFCVELRKTFFEGLTEKTPRSAIRLRLHETVFMAISSTIQKLIQGRSYIASDTVHAYNFLLGKKNSDKK